MLIPLIVALVIGFVFAFLGSIPVAGPIAAIVLSRGLEHRNRAGIFITIGAAVAEAAYAFLAFWGFSTVLSHFPALLSATRFAGCAILIALGIYFAVREQRPIAAAQREDRTGLTGVRNLLLGFWITAINPTLILTWTAAVGAAHSTGILDLRPRDALPFSLGACAGIIAWFALLLSLLNRFRGGLNPARRQAVMRALGAALVVLGVVFAARTLIHWS